MAAPVLQNTVQDGNMLDLDEVERRYGVQWRFDTARYTVAFWAEDEDIDPADSFSDPRDVTFATRVDGRGEQFEPAQWFRAFVGIFNDEGVYIAHDCLGGCSYNSFEEFYSSHRWQYQRAGARRGKWLKSCRDKGWKHCRGSSGTYFTDMVRECIRQARHEAAFQSEGARRA